MLLLLVGRAGRAAGREDWRVGAGADRRSRWSRCADAARCARIAVPLLARPRARPAPSCSASSKSGWPALDDIRANGARAPT